MLKKKRVKKKKLRSTAGFSLVELLVAVAVFSVMVVPLISTFVVTARINAKGRQREQAMTIAQNLMESIKGFGLEELSKQCNGLTPIAVVPDNGGSYRAVTGQEISIPSSCADGAFVGHAAVEKETDFTYTLLDGVTTVTGTLMVDETPYVFRLEDIVMGKTYFDAEITITQNADDLEYLVSSLYTTGFDELGLQSLKCYKVEIKVFFHENSSYQFTDTLWRASYEGTFLDKR